MSDLQLEILWKAMGKLPLVQEEGFISDKQLEVIERIHINTGIKFEGFTRLDAQKFISKNIDKSKSGVDTYQKITVGYIVQEVERESFKL